MMGIVGLLGGLVLLVIGWVVARVLRGRGPDGAASFSVAAFSLGPAASAVVATAVLARAIGYLAGASGPMAWVGVAAGAPTDPNPYLDAFARLAGGFALIAAITAIVHAVLRANAPFPRGPRVGSAMPLGLLAAIVTLVAGLIAGIAFVSSALAWTAGGLPLDLAAFAPIAAAALAIRFLARAAPDKVADDAPAPTSTASAAPKPPKGPVDVDPLLRKSGLLAEKPVFELAGRSATGAPKGDTLDRLWLAAGGVAGTPAPLRTALETLGPGGACHLVGDLALETEDAILHTALLQALTVAGERVLVIGSDPARRRDALRRILEAQRIWPAGALVAGGAELERSLHEGLVPAIAFLDLDALSGHARLLSSGRGRTFADGLGLVVLSRPDALVPLEATHLQFSMKRLGLLWWGTDRAPAVLATGGSTPSARRYVEDLAGRPVRLLPAGLESTATIRVQRTLAPAGRAQERDAVRKLLQSFENSPASIVVEDPNAHLSAPDVDVPKVSAKLSRQPSLQGDLALSLLDDGWIATLFREARSVLPRPTAPRQTSLWWVPVTPLSRFLLLPNVLQSLDQSGELPTPRPIAGRRNRWLAAAHLEAALAEGAHDESALRAAFGDDAVNERLKLEPPLVAAGHRARIDPKTQAIVRSAVWQPPPGHRWVDPHRSTVTRDVIEIVDGRSGAVLETVDRRLAPTRFYPLRVFGHGSGRYQVPPDAWTTPPKKQLAVRQADERAGWTAPQLDLEARCDRLPEEPVVVAKNDVSLAVTSAPVEVRETVRGARTLDASGSDLSFPPVTSSYPSRATVAFLAFSRSPKALFHLARVVDALLPAHVRAAQEDVEVIAVESFGGLARPALVFVDRHLGGMGVAEVLDADALHDLLRWARGVLFHCPCMDGCANCTPPEVLAAGADKQGVLAMLGAGGPARRAG